MYFIYALVKLLFSLRTKNITVADSGENSASIMNSYKGLLDSIQSRRKPRHAPNLVLYCSSSLLLLCFTFFFGTLLLTVQIACCPVILKCKKRKEKKLASDIFLAATKINILNNKPKKKKRQQMPFLFLFSLCNTI